MKQFSDLKILLVEDNPADARLIVSLVNAVLRTSCDTVSTLKGAMDALAAEAYDLLLLDIVLPDNETLEGLSTVCATHPAVPVIIVTGLEETLALEAVARGALDFVRKDTLSPDVISRSVLYALRRQEVQNELTDMKSRRRQDIQKLYTSMRDMQSFLSRRDPVDRHDSGPLRLVDPVRYQNLLEFYRQSFTAFMERIREGRNLIGFGKSLGVALADHNATPDDAATMHMTVLEELRSGRDEDELQAIASEGRMFALEVMAHLANHYRGKMHEQ